MKQPLTLSARVERMDGLGACAIARELHPFPPLRNELDAVSRRCHACTRLFPKLAGHRLGSETPGPRREYQAVVHTIEIDFNPIAGLYLVGSDEV